MEFDKWLKENTNLSDSSIYKYTHALNTISNEMMDSNVINKPLNEMELFELDLAILLIFQNNYFIKKDKVGNKMYSNALKHFRCFSEQTNKNIATVLNEEVKINTNVNLNKTERETIVKSRIGQGIFREQLIDKYHNCIVTKVTLPQILIASHIKPWSVSSNKERIDVNNGLLLSATYDRLFDSGLITFLDSGEICLSKIISKDNALKLGLQNKDKYDILYNTNMKEYLQYHNDVIFVR